MQYQTQLFRAVLAWNNLQKFLKDIDSTSQFKSGFIKTKTYCQCKSCL